MKGWGDNIVAKFVFFFIISFLVFPVSQKVPKLGVVFIASAGGWSKKGDLLGVRRYCSYLYFESFYALTNLTKWQAMAWKSQAVFSVKLVAGNQNIIVKSKEIKHKTWWLPAILCFYLYLVELQEGRPKSLFFQL